MLREQQNTQERSALRSGSFRRARFASRQEVLERYDGRGAFAGWRADLLEAFVRDGLVDCEDGSVTLKCDPANEVAMLRHIFAAMEGTYLAESPDHPFSALRRVNRPTMVATTERSQPIYKTMADVVAELVPRSSRVHFDGLGHSAALADPQRVADEVLRFWAANAQR